MDLFNDAPNGFYLYHGNRLEQLAAVLAGRLEEGHGSDPLRADQIVVQSRGMARWLNMALAAAAGIAANLEFPFPRHFLRDYIFGPLARQYGGSTADFAFFEPENLTWRIAAILPELLPQPEFRMLEQYLSGDNHNLKLIQLAERLARVFDRYLTYRPDLINAWDRGVNPLTEQPDGRWQQLLWQAVTADRRHTHPAFYYQVLLEQLYPEQFPRERQSNAAPADFSGLRQLQRVFFFGFSSLAPMYLDIIFAVSRLIRVDFYYLNPCAEYWEYNRAYRRLLHEAGNRPMSSVTAADVRNTAPFAAVAEAAFECANPLLGSWGEQGREFFALINAADLTADEPCFAPEETPAGAGLLTWIQDDITRLRLAAVRTPFDPHDDTLQFHSCHSRMREVEVLYENLLHLFLNRPGLRPEDVLVLAPDINAYAPYIEAVFNTVDPASPQWCYATIADRAANAARPEVVAWLRLLTLDRERFRVNAVLDLLEPDAVRNRCGIDEDDLDRIRRWLRDNGVNWGLDDAYHREKSGVAFRQNSWRFGLERMLAGFALHPDHPGSSALWTTADGDILPYDNIEGDSAVLLGKLCDFLDRLIVLHDHLRCYEHHGAAPEEWRILLNRTVDDFLQPDRDNIDGIQAIRDAIENWYAAVVTGGGDRAATLRLDPAAILYCLRRHLDDTNATGGFLQGGITFCQAKPLRSIPARVICLLGMDDGAFPRQDRKTSFDLMATRPRLGDRSARGDDRYLLLETLMSAREVFYLSYVGQNIRENTSIPPAAPVCELLDLLADHYLAPPAPDTPPQQHRQQTAEQLVVRHPLQAFSRRYFTPKDRENHRLVSYSTENCRAAAALRHARTAGPLPPPAPKCESPLPEEMRRLTLHDLADFLANPARAFCRRRAGIRLELRDDQSPDDREPFALDALDRYQFGNELLQRGLAATASGTTPTPTMSAAVAAAARRTMTASGLLPVGAQGEIAFDRFQEDFTPFCDAMLTMLSAPLPSVNHLIVFPELQFELEISLDQLYRCRDGKVRQVFYRFGRLRVADELNARLHHLVLGTDTLRSDAVTATVDETIFFTRDHHLNCRGAIPSPPDSFRALSTLLQLYRSGMKEPLPFEPEAALAAWNILSRNGAPEEAIAHAAAKWPDADSRYSHYDDYLRFCHGDAMPETPAFRTAFLRHTRTVFATLDPVGREGEA
ncbi:MAG: exodeoxyribonuclease V subunit gamma [Victivallales bacterium]|nr:exodeoxyribonuclease V subunit gamma [Victivallales bacterium]